LPGSDGIERMQAQTARPTVASTSLLGLEQLDSLLATCVGPY
jgi:hypothetical protein